jgi:hypothetical protein
VNSKRIKTPTPISRDKYWEMQMKGPEIPLLDKPCHDCAITTNFYTPIADELLKESEHIQDEVLKRWYCHNHTNCACRGAYNYIHVKRKKG